jgi:hypothetical protein
MVRATWLERHSILAGSVDTTPSTHNTWSPRLTFHKPGPGITPVTVIACRVVIDPAGAGVAVVAGAGGVVGGVCAAAQAQTNNKMQGVGAIRMVQ